MKEFSFKNLQMELSERAIFEKRPSELSENDLTFVLGSLHISLVVSFFETDPLEKFTAMTWVVTMTDALQKWANWKVSQILDAAIEAMDGWGED